MSPKYSILTFCAYYAPGYKYGGPVQSVANLVSHLGRELSFRIITRDRDFGDSKPYPEIRTGEWERVGNGEVFYLDAKDHSLITVARVMRETPHHAIYLNSLFHFRSTILPLLAQRFGIAPRRPVILAPRGEFASSALAFKANKKKMYLAVAKRLDLYGSVIWKASSPHEAEDIRAVIGGEANIHIASDLPRPVASGLPHTLRIAGQPLRVLFLSRVSPMKNLKFALQALSCVRVPVDFSIVGPVSDPAYWDECKVVMESLPAHVSARHLGEVPPDEVQGIMAQNDLLFLPTLGENFGHVIIEALGAGTPALISNQTPWQDFEKAGCGWVEPLGAPELFADRIEALFEQSVEAVAAGRQAALAYARNFTERSTIIEDNRKLFRKLLSRSE